MLKGLCPLKTPEGGSELPRKRIVEAGFTKMVAVRLTEADYENYEAKVSESGMSSSEYLRECVLKNRTTVIAQEKPRVEKSQALYLINITAHDIERLARFFQNQFEAQCIDGETYHALLVRLDSLLQALLREVLTC